MIEKKYIDVIREFDLNINNYVIDLQSKIEDINFDIGTSIVFVMTSDLDTKAIFSNIKKQGLYLFELNVDSLYPNVKYRKTKLKRFADDWKKKKNDSFFSSSIIQSRLKKYEQFNEEWIPLYIGKNKNLNKRLIEHVDLDPKKQTYAMKLRHRPSFSNAKYRVSILELDVKNYDFIVPHIERVLRDKYIPIVGKQ